MPAASRLQGFERVSLGRCFLILPRPPPSPICRLQASTLGSGRIAFWGMHHTVPLPPTAASVPPAALPPCSGPYSRLHASHLRLILFQHACSQLLVPAGAYLFVSRLPPASSSACCSCPYLRRASDPDEPIFFLELFYDPEYTLFEGCQCDQVRDTTCLSLTIKTSACPCWDTLQLTDQSNHWNRLHGL